MNSLETDVVLPYTNSPCSNESIHNVPHPKTMVKTNPPLLAYGVDDSIGELGLPNILGLHSIQPCQDQEEDVVSQVINQPSHVETIVDDLTKLTKLHHTSGIDGMPSHNNVEGDVVCKGIDYSSKGAYSPMFLFKEDVINDITP